MAISQSRSDRVRMCISLLQEARTKEPHRLVRELYLMAINKLHKILDENRRKGVRKEYALACGYVETALHIHMSTRDGPYESTRIRNELKMLSENETAQPGSKRMFQQVQNKRPFRKLSIEST